MNDKQLADRIVALGVGEDSTPYDPVINGFYAIDELEYWDEQVIGKKDQDPWMEPPAFVRDPRVAMALMFKTLLKCGHTRGLAFKDVFNQALDLMESYRIVPEESDFTRAICEACVGALEQ